MSRISHSCAAPERRLGSFRRLESPRGNRIDPRLSIGQRRRPLDRRALRSRESAFTVIEIICVILVVGIFMTITALNMSGLSPKYRLRTSIRTLGSKVEEQRIRALTKGVWMGVRYNFDGRLDGGKNRTFYELLQPPPKEFPHQPLHDRPPYPPQFLEPGVELMSVQIRGTGEIIDSGSILIPFSTNGTTGSHVVTLRNNEGMMWTMKLNSITGTVDYSNNEQDFEDFEG